MRAMEIADASVEFLLRERYLLSAFELLHEMIENGMADSKPASRLSQFFADPELFPADQLLQVQSLQESDAQRLREGKISAEERAAVLEYELRLAQEDVKALRSKLDTANPETTARDYESTEPLHATSSNTSRIGINERKDLNHAVREYLVSAGYKLTAMTFYEEVVDHDLDDDHVHIPDALRTYYRAYISKEHDQRQDLQEAPPMAKNGDLLIEVKDAFEKERTSLNKAIEDACADALQQRATVDELREALKQVSSELDGTKAELVSLKEQQESFARYKEQQESFARYQETQDLENEKVINTVETIHEEPPHPSEERLSFPEEKHREDPETIRILADGLPKIVPYVLINHREELLPLIICAIGRHPDSNVRDSLTHILFNLIKRPDEEQRRIIMEACISLSKSIGELRTETELLPQCWEQINHNYEERRLLVAQSCGELAKFVRSDMRSSLILSILEQLIEDPMAVVRESASYNLAHLLPLFPNTEKYNKVEKMMFHLLSDASGQVIETTLKELIPAVVTWGSSIKQLLRNLLNRMLSIAQRCPPMSGVENSSDSQLRSLGERERWNIEVLLRMLTQLLPDLSRACIDSYPFEMSEVNGAVLLSEDHLKQYVTTETKWDYFDWLAMDLFPCLLKLLCMLPPKEEVLRRTICQFLIAVRQCFGEHYHVMVVKPIFLTALGDDSQLSSLGSTISTRISSLKPQTDTAQYLAFKCILPLFLAGVLTDTTTLSTFLKNLILDSSLKHGLWNCVQTAELIESIRFLCSFVQHHEVITNVFWELVLNTNTSVKVHTALLLKELVPYASVQLVTQQLLPALITLASDTNLEVKYTSIPAFGVVAQHFTDDMVTDKIRVQMDGFLDDGSNEAVIGVVRTLASAVPLAAPALRDYLLQKLLVLTADSMGTNPKRRREKADVFCEAIRSLDGTDLSAVSVRELLLPTIQNLMRDPDLLDPAHKEALEMITRERSAGKFEAITKVVNAHLSMSTRSMSTIFGESTPSTPQSISEQPSSPTQLEQQQEEGVLKRMMRNKLW